MWIEEIKQDLTGRRLDIWRGHDENGVPLNISTVDQEAYRNLWRSQVGKLEALQVKLEDCLHHGAEVRDVDGRPVTRDCGLG